MAVNITVHSNPVKLRNEKYMLYDEGKKADIENRRKIRLLQVRAQSKEIAQNIRKKVSEKKEQKLAEIYALKNLELKNWKERQMLKLRKTYANNLSHVGDAHNLVDEQEKLERNRNRRIQEQKLKNRRMALRRGRMAAAAEHQKNSEKINKKTTKPCIQSRCIDTTSDINLDKEQTAFEHSKLNTTTKPHQHKAIYADVTIKSPDISLSNSDIEVDDDDADDIDNDTLTDLSIRSPEKMSKAKISDYIDLSTTTTENSSSISEIIVKKKKSEDCVPTVSMSITHDMPTVRDIQKYSPKKFTSIDVSHLSSDSSIECSSLVENVKPVFTKITDLIKTRKQLEQFKPTELMNSVRPSSPEGIIKTRDFQSISNKSNITDVSPELQVPASTSTITTSKINTPMTTTSMVTSVSATLPANHNLPIRKQSVNQHIRPIPTFSKVSIKTPNDRNIFIPNFTNLKGIQLPPQPPQQPPPSLPKATTVTRGISTSLSIKPQTAQKLQKDFTKTKSHLKDIVTTTTTSQPNTTTISTSQEHSPQKVRFYDHTNRYTKEYEAPMNIVSKESIESNQRSAMQLAEQEILNENLRLERLADMRKRDEQRGLEALEKQQTRKDYELLTEQLEQFTKEENQLKASINPNVQFSHEWLKQLYAGRQSKMNSAFETLLTTPVLITCPRVNEVYTNKKSLCKDSLSSGLNVGAIVTSSTSNADSEELLSTSDSCKSIILLDAINNRSIDLSKDIKTCLDDKNRKTLTDLLDKINAQKLELLKQLHGANVQSDESQKLSSSSSLDDLQGKLTTQRSSKTHKIDTNRLTKELEDLEKCKKQLKAREQQFESKIKQLYEQEKMRRQKQKKDEFTDNLQKDILRNAQQPTELQTIIKTPTTVPTTSVSTSTKTQSDQQKPVNANNIIIESSSSNESNNINNHRVEIIIKVDGSSKVKKRSKSQTRTDKELSSGRNKISPIVIDKETNTSQSFEQLHTDTVTDQDKLRKVSITNEPLKSNHELHTQTIDETPVVNKLLPRNSAQSTASTSYRSPPPTILTEFSKFLHQNANKEPKIQIDRNKKKKPLVAVTAATTTNKNHMKSSDKFNPVLIDYITRLLGMSRLSIDQLGTSSTSSVETPTQSIVNISTNFTNTTNSGNDSQASTPLTTSVNSLNNTEPFNEERLVKLKQFIDNNYNFLTDLDNTLRQEQIPSESNDNNLKEVEQIWMRLLKEKETEMKRLKEKCKNLENSLKMKDSDKKTPTTVNNGKQLKPILKRPLRQIQPNSNNNTNNNNNNIPKPDNNNITTANRTTSTESIETSPSEKERNLFTKYSELTADCTKRISDLTEMINRVREEKKKLIEKSYSLTTSSTDNDNGDNGVGSSGRGGDNTTEYLDFRIGRSNNANDSSTKSLNDDGDIDNNEIANQNLHKQIGLSRDSGICSVSRPVTSSPDFTHETISTEKPNQLINSNENIDNVFEVLKDIPKVSPRRFSANGNTNILDNKMEWNGGSGGGSSVQKSNKTTKPPTTLLTRYSPQMDQEIPHELSTIIEVDTPITSKINISLPNLNINNNSELSTRYKELPTFYEYARLHNLDLTQFDLDDISSMHLTDELKRLLELTLTDDLQYRKFQSEPPIISQSILTNRDNDVQNKSAVNVIRQNSMNNLHSTTTADLKHKEFPTHEEYAKNTSDLMHSSSLDSENNSNTNNNVVESNADEDSDFLPSNLIDELKRRNIVPDSFTYKFDDKSEVDEQKNQSNIQRKSDDNNENPRTSLELFQNDLKRIGMQWASTLIKKTKETQALTSTSSSSSSLDVSSKRRPINKSGHKQLKSIPVKNVEDTVIDTNQCSTLPDIDSTSIDHRQPNIDKNNTVDSTSSNRNNIGKPLNLRDFLERELLKGSTSFSSNNSTTSNLSSTSYQQQLQLLLSRYQNAQQTNVDRQNHTSVRTSTPVQQQNSGTAGSGIPTTGSKKLQQSSTICNLFANESSISSVRQQSSSESSNKDSNLSSKDETDPLVVPELKLKHSNYST